MKSGTIMLGAIVLAVVVSIGWWVKANYFEAGAWLVTQDDTVKWAYRYNAKGGDIRVYGFEHPWGRCVLMAGTRNSTGECQWNNGEQKDVGEQ